MSRPTFDAVAVGDVLPPVEYPLHRLDLVRYAGASGDFNPIHWNARVAAEVGLPDVIAHGMLTMATAVRCVTDWCGDPGAVVDYGTRFTNPVPVPDVASSASAAGAPGAVVQVSGTVAARDEQARTVRVDLSVTCAGERVLGKCQATVRLP